MDWRLKKQITYISIFFVLFFLLPFSIYFIFLKKPLPPSCFDNIKNQGEEGIDCGGPCPPCELKYFQPLKIFPTEFLIYSNKNIDILGLIENPNENLGIKKLKYQFLIYDLDNNLKEILEDETILEPLEKRYLLKINYQPSFDIGKIDLKILEPTKEDFLKTQKETLPISIYNQKIFQENNRYKVSFTLFNNSYRPLINIETIVLVYNINNQLIATTKSLISLGPQQIKNIVLSLPDIFEPKGLEIFLQRTSFEK